jgi:hypothetical protein
VKMYVQGYRPLERGKDDPLDIGADVLYDVSYTHEPEWKMFDGEADGELMILRRFRVHVGSHYCDFSIEPLPEGKVAIVCLSHPGPTR